LISRVAESCFWLFRYLERVESAARLLEVNLAFVLDVDLPALDRWHPPVIVTGEQERFAELFGMDAARDREVVQRYMVWDRRNPVSFTSSLHWARENARTIREAISLDLWEALNSFWLWLSEGKGKRLYERDRAAFYRRVKAKVAHFHGVCQSTMPHDTPLDFMRLGLLLERAGQTGRILDVKYHQLGPTRTASETTIEAAQWLALLRSCSASEAFVRQRQALTGPAVAEFLLFDPRFPRSVLHCLDRAWHLLRRVSSPDELPPIGAASQALLSSLLERMLGEGIAQVVQAGLHDEITRIVDATTAVCSAVHADFFDPPVPAAAVRAEAGAPA
jgi:uncharacterized alpha-E superfamily protein